MATKERKSMVHVEANPAIFADSDDRACVTVVKGNGRVDREAMNHLPPKQVPSIFKTTAEGLADPVKGRELRSALSSCLVELGNDLAAPKREECARLTGQMLATAHAVGNGDAAPKPR